MAVTGGMAGRCRLLLWGGAALLLLLPWLAMRFTAEVNWSAADFAVFGAMLAGACGAYEMAARHSGSRSFRAAAAIAIATAFVVVWVSLAVGT